jgi:fatty acid desaturase
MSDAAVALLDEKSRVLATPAVHAAVAGLFIVDPWRGVWRTVFNIIVANTLLFLTLASDSWAVFIPLAVVTGFFYSSIMITTHDAMHHTLSGWYWFDELVPRFYSYFIFWPHGLYGELHRLHHKFNGRDLEDPENPTVTEETFNRAGTIGKFFLRHKLWLSLFLYGGIGLIIQHFAEGFRRWRSHKPVRMLIVTDIIGILIATAVTIAVVSYTGITWKYALYLLLVERVLGFAMQLRLHIEHYGLWGDRSAIIETRLYNCRNIRTNAIGEWFYNGLNYHSVHHAFPAIPYYHLRQAHEKLSPLCAAGGKPLPTEHGYLRTIFALAKTPMLITSTNDIRPIPNCAKVL